MGYRASREQEAGQEDPFLERATDAYLARIADHNTEVISLSHPHSLEGSLSHVYESRQANNVVAVLSSIALYIRRLIFNDK